MTKQKCDAMLAVEEQQAIVEHIARANEKIDAVHELAERANPLLMECRSALIAAAVTGEINVGRWHDQRVGHAGASVLSFRAVVCNGAELNT